MTQNQCPTSCSCHPCSNKGPSADRRNTAVALKFATGKSVGSARLGSARCPPESATIALQTQKLQGPLKGTVGLLVFALRESRPHSALFVGGLSRSDVVLTCFTKSIIC
ncbi:unnamed protein product [Soboliphyme baturini]|uniref:Uncharacterized protein n=1 Tax=Soboliphyme baturini TaxID=241478 RepID=A0A183IT95_9BILA|nr:unnamed protein product [Soboliphyme baturini]